MLGEHFGEKIYCDVLVIGGGMAGVGAAVSAATPGIKVMLIEKNSFLGGIATASLVSTVCGCYASTGERLKIIGGVWDFVIEELKALNGINEGINRDTHRSDICDPELLKCALDNVIVKRNIELFLNSQVIDVTVTNRKIQMVYIINNESGRKYVIFPQRVIDATGNALINYLTDSQSYVQGNERGGIQASTMVFRLNNVDCDVAQGVTKSRIKELILEAKKKGEYNQERVNGVFTIMPDNKSAIINVNWVNTNDMNSVNLTGGQIEGRKKVLENYLFFKKYVPGFQNCVISSIASNLGIRETRRIVGEYVLNEDDIIAGREFTDGIALCSWPMEYHDYENAKLSYSWVKKSYQIPYRCMLPKHLDNLLVAGRSISTTSMAYSSTRVMGPCLATGQAAGLAMRLSLQQECSPKDINMRVLREKLVDEGMII